MRASFLVEPGAAAGLAGRDPREALGIDKKEGRRRAKINLARLYDLHYLLHAENKRAVLIVLQGMDAAGKSGTVRHIMSGLNPLGCETTSFKKPTAEELDHDFLWRIHKAVPAKGNIGVFDRSHYEDVGVVRVLDLVPKPVWSARFEQINAFEQLLSDNNVLVLKFFLHISKDEQRERLQERLDDERRHWKISPSDFEARKQWDEYQQAYEDALTRCSTEHAPWFVIPSDRKWFRNLAISTILVEALEAQDMKFPPPSCDVSKIVLD